LTIRTLAAFRLATMNVGSGCAGVCGITLSTGSDGLGIWNIMADAGNGGLDVCNIAMDIGNSSVIFCSVLTSARAGCTRVYPEFGLEAGG